MSDSISLHKRFGSLNQFIVKVGIACRTALINTSQPAYERSFSFQPWILCQTLSRM